MNKITDYCKNTDEWPNSWKREKRDIEVGERILRNIFIPFFRFLIEKQFTKKTIKKHTNNIWLLGGELIDRVEQEEELRTLNELELVLKFVDSRGGPYSNHIDSESEMISFDSSCKKLYKYLKSIN